jgi:hypothetical protein
MRQKRERGKEKKAAQSQEERGRAEEKEKGEVATAIEEKGQQAEVSTRVARTDAPYVDPPSDKAPR